MASRPGENCFLVCEDCQEITELKDVGISIFRYKVNLGNVEGDETTGDLEVKTGSTKDIFIVMNKDAPDPVDRDFDSSKITCKQCQYISKHGQKLIELDLGIDKGNVTGICDHCRSKQKSRDLRTMCDEIIKKYFFGVSRRDRDKHFRTWFPTPSQRPCSETDLRRTMHKRLKPSRDMETERGREYLPRYHSEESLISPFPQLLDEQYPQNKLVFPKDSKREMLARPDMGSAELIAGIREKKRAQDEEEELRRAKGRGYEEKEGEREIKGAKSYGEVEAPGKKGTLQRPYSAESEAAVRDKQVPKSKEGLERKEKGTVGKGDIGRTPSGQRDVQAKQEKQAGTRGEISKPEGQKGQAGPKGDFRKPEASKGQATTRGEISKPEGPKREMGIKSEASKPEGQKGPAGTKGELGRPEGQKGQKGATERDAQPEKEGKPGKGKIGTKYEAKEVTQKGKTEFDKTPSKDTEKARKEKSAAQPGKTGKEKPQKKEKEIDDTAKLKASQEADSRRKAKQKPEDFLPKYEKAKKTKDKKIKARKGETIKTDKDIRHVDLRSKGLKAAPSKLMEQHRKKASAQEREMKAEAEKPDGKKVEVKMNQVLMQAEKSEVKYALPKATPLANFQMIHALPTVPRKYALMTIDAENIFDDLEIKPGPKLKMKDGMYDEKEIRDILRKRKMGLMVDIDSDDEIDLESMLRTRGKKPVRKQNLIKGKEIIKLTPAEFQKELEEKVSSEKPMLFKQTFNDKSIGDLDEQVSTEETKEIDIDMEARQVTRFTLSDRTFIDKGWTMLPTEKILRKMNIYRMRPSRPEFDWFKTNRSKGYIKYETGEKLAEFEDDGRAHCYYRNGRLALNYYDAEESNAQQRYVVFSSGELDSRGHSRPITVLAMFDYAGNGVVFDHNGKIRLKYDQSEGVILDRSLGPVTHWKWHSLNDPPVLQQVMIDTHMTFKDPKIIQLGELEEDHKGRPEDDEQMLAIELENFVKEKNKKLSAPFHPYQIKMKALKINEQFSLKILDQATIHLLFQDGTTHLKLNLGMILDHHEIVDIDTVELGDVSNSLEKFPARTSSIEGLQRILEKTQRKDRVRMVRENRLRPPAPRTVESADHLTSMASHRLPIHCNAGRSNIPNHGGQRKSPPSSLYYDTRIV